MEEFKEKNENGESLEQKGEGDIEMNNGTDRY